MHALSPTELRQVRASLETINLRILGFGPEVSLQRVSE